MDDTTGWDEVLRASWSDHVRDLVVARIEEATVARRGWLVRVVADPDRVRPALTELVHALVLAAIRDETGADLEELGSQAAWECYEEVWRELERRWVRGGTLATVPLGHEVEVVRALHRLPAEAAVAAGADVTSTGTEPLCTAGRLRLDVEGLLAYRALDGGRLPTAVAADVRLLLAVVGAG
ncbi:MAG: hypothetical protein ACNA8R_11340 [Nitriliruptoraceae bacterium]